MRAILVIIVCLLAIGCRADRRCSRETALLRAEILDLEDKYYQLKSSHEMTVSELDGFQGIPGEVIYEDGIIYEDELIKEPLNSDSIAPQIDTATGNVTARQIHYDNQPFILKSDNSIRDQNDLQVDLGDSNAEITEVLINRTITRGHDVDGVPGDEGLDLFIEPRTADGNVVLQPGEMTVSLIDPAEDPEHQRIGLWRFLHGETELFFAKDDSGKQGILLHLPWEQRTPVNQQLIVHFRFVTREGETLKTSTEVRITPPSANYSPGDPMVDRWTKLDSRWISAQQGRPPKSTAPKTAIQKPSWRPVR